MSEESSSSPLRLKPKLKVDSESLASAMGINMASTSPPGESAVQDDGGLGLKLKPRGISSKSGPVADVTSEGQTAVDSRVRLKPRLAVRAEPQPEALAKVWPTTPPPAVIVPPVAAVVPPPLIAVTDDAGSTLVGGFKLRPKSAGDDPPPFSLPGATVIPPEGSTAGVPAPAEAPRLRVKPSPELVKSFSSGNTAPPFPSATGSGKRSALTMVVLLLLVAGGAYYVYSTYIAPGSSEPVASDPAPGPADVAGPTSMPGRLVGKVQNSQADGLEGLEELGIESRVPAIPADTIEPGVMASMPVRAEASPAPEPEISEAFHRFVTEMRVSGVFQGNPPRALVNGRMVRAGESLDLGLGIVFTGIDAENHLILMQEPLGARAAKKY